MAVLEITGINTTAFEGYDIAYDLQVDEGSWDPGNSQTPGSYVENVTTVGENSGCVGLDACGVFAFQFGTITYPLADTPSITMTLFDNDPTALCSGPNDWCYVNINGDSATYSIPLNSGSGVTGGDEGTRQAIVDYTMLVETLPSYEASTRLSMVQDFENYVDALDASDYSTICPTASQLLQPVEDPYLVADLIEEAFDFIIYSEGGYEAEEGTAWIEDLVLTAIQEYGDLPFDAVTVDNADLYTMIGYPEAVADIPGLTNVQPGAWTCGNLFLLWNIDLEESEAGTYSGDVANWETALTRYEADLGAEVSEIDSDDLSAEVSTLETEGSLTSGDLGELAQTTSALESDLEQIVTGDTPAGFDCTAYLGGGCPAAAQFLLNQLLLPLYGGSSNSILDSDAMMISNLLSEFGFFQSSLAFSASDSCSIPTDVPVNLPYNPPIGAGTFLVQGGLPPYQISTTASTSQWMYASPSSYSANGVYVDGWNFQADTSEEYISAGESFTFTVEVEDAVGDTATLCATELVATAISAPPTAFTILRSNVDVGQLEEYSFTPSGGSGEYTYAWSWPQGLGCSTSTSDSLSCYPTQPLDEVSPTLTVMDTLSGLTATGEPNPIMVYSDPEMTNVQKCYYNWVSSAATCSSDLGSALTADAGEFISVQPMVSGGSGDLSYAFNPPASLTSCSNPTPDVQTCATSGPGELSSWGLTATDSDGIGTSLTGEGLFVINPDPTVSVDANQQTIDYSQSVSFTAITSGGTGPFTYLWEVFIEVGGGLSPISSGCSYSSASGQVPSSVDACSGLTPGTYQVGVIATDGTGCSTGAGPGTCSGADTEMTFVVNSDPEVDASESYVVGADVGQTIDETVVPSGGSGSFQTFFWTESSPEFGCTSADWDIQTGTGTTTTPMLSCTPTVAGTYTLTVAVMDSTGCYSMSVDSCDITPIVLPSLIAAPQLVVTFTPSSATSADVGEIEQLSATASGGLAPFTYAWGQLPPGCVSSNSPSISCAPSEPGVYEVELDVTDANHNTISAFQSFVVYNDPVITGLAGVNDLGISTVTADIGQSLTIFPTMNSGSDTIVEVDWTSVDSNLGCVLTGSEATPELDCDPTGIGTFDVSVQVVDANDETSPIFTMGIVVYCDPLVSPAYSTTINPDDVQNRIHLEADASLGTGSYSYSWAGLPGGCESLSEYLIPCDPNTGTEGAYDLIVMVTDSNGWVVYSAPSTFVVTALPSVTVEASVASVDVGQSVTFTAVVTGGSGVASYSWAQVPAGCTAAFPSFTCSPDAAGSTYSVQVRITDTSGFGASGSLSPFRVYSDPVVTSFQASAATVDVGQQTQFTVEVEGGTGSYSYLWTGLPTGCNTEDGASLACTPLGSGTFSVEVTVADSNGYAVLSGSLSITVDPDPILGGDGSVTPVATLAVGNNPWGVYIDQSTNIAFVINAGNSYPDDTVVEVNLVTDQVVLTIDTNLVEPRSVWYDETTNYVWVSGGQSNCVAVFDATTGDLLATIPVGDSANSMVYDSVHDSLWVTDFESSQISEISIATMSVMNTINTGPGTYPYYATFDPTTDLLFVTDSAYDNLVYAIDAATGAIVGTVSVPTSPYAQDLVYTENQEVFVTAQGSSQISEFPEDDLSDVTTISGPYGAWGLAYDSELDLLAVGGVYGNDAEFLCASDFTPLSLSSGPLDVTAPYSMAFDPSLNVLAVDSLASYPNFGEGELEIYNVAGLAGECPDSAPADAPLVSTSSIDLGQSIAFSVAVEGGTGTYSYQWSGLPTGCTSQDSPTIICTPTAASDPEVTVAITDSNGFTVTSEATSVTVEQPISLATPTPSADSFVVGDPFTISASPEGGSGSYTTYLWNESDSSLGCGLTTNSPTLSCDPTEVGSYTVWLYVTDSDGATVSSDLLSLLVMNWNSGNLCSVSKGNCQFTGSSHCSPALAYSFNGSLQTFSVKLTGSSDCVYLNVSGSHDVINIQITGSSMPYFQLVVAGNHDYVNLEVTGSTDSTFVYVFGQHDVYNFTATGSSLVAKAYFLGFAPGSDSAPDGNLSATDSYHLSLVGSSDTVSLVYVNSVGWSSSAQSVKAPSIIATGSNDYLVYQNLTGLWAGPWDTASGYPSFIPSTPTGAIPQGDPP